MIDAKILEMLKSENTELATLAVMAILRQENGLKKLRAFLELNGRPYNRSAISVHYKIITHEVWFHTNVTINPVYVNLWGPYYVYAGTTLFVFKITSNKWCTWAKSIKDRSIQLYDK